MKNLDQLTTAKTIQKENAVLEAQKWSKVAAFNVAELFTKLLNDALELGFIKKFKVKVLPYNTGYEIKVDADRGDWRRLGSDSKYDEFQRFLFSNSCTTIQPDTFFNENFNEGRATRIEGKVISLKGDDYGRYDVTTFQSIKTVCSLYFKECELGFKEIRRNLELS